MRSTTGLACNFEGKRVRQKRLKKSAKELTRCMSTQDTLLRQCNHYQHLSQEDKSD
jgi:hypothetical protein